MLKEYRVLKLLTDFLGPLGVTLIKKLTLPNFYIQDHTITHTDYGYVVVGHNRKFSYTGENFDKFLEALRLDLVDLLGLDGNFASVQIVRMKSTLTRFFMVSGIPIVSIKTSSKFSITSLPNVEKEARVCYNTEQFLSLSKTDRSPVVVINLDCLTADYAAKLVYMVNNFGAFDVFDKTDGSSVVRRVDKEDLQTDIIKKLQMLTGQSKGAVVLPVSEEHIGETITLIDDGGFTVWSDRTVEAQKSVFNPACKTRKPE